MLLKDFRSGKVFDAPGLLAEVEGLSLPDACKLFIELAGVQSGASSFPRHDEPRPCAAVYDPAEREKPQFPPLDRGRAGDVEALARLRSVSVEAVSLAIERGLLRFADSMEGRAWLVLDSSRWCGIARRLDGAGWECLRGAKARMLRGSRGAWPIGAPDVAPFPCLAVVEGGPDALAAFEFALRSGVVERLGVVVMPSASSAIPADSLPFFADKRCRVFMDSDAPGRAAFARWASQLAEVGAEVDGFDFSGLFRADGEPVRDLNDALLLSVDSWERFGGVVDNCMDFATGPGCACAPAGGACEPAGGADSGGEIPSALARFSMAEVEAARAAGFADDPLFLKALEIFEAESIRFEQEETSCPA
jgi:hypothetical protein